MVLKLNNYIKLKTALLLTKYVLIYCLISYYCNSVKEVLEELLRTHLYFNEIFYLNFRKKLLILIEVNFSNLLHCPRF